MKSVKGITQEQAQKLAYPRSLTPEQQELMSWHSLSHTLQAKVAFEKINAKAGRTVKHYQAESGRFADNTFLDAFKLMKTITPSHTVVSAPIIKMASLRIRTNNLLKLHKHFCSTE